MADRYKISDGALVGVVSCVLKSGGSNLKDFDLSISTAHRGREAIRENEYASFYKDFKAPKHAIIGWDGKLVKSTNILGFR